MYIYRKLLFDEPRTTENFWAHSCRRNTLLTHTRCTDSSTRYGDLPTDISECHPTLKQTLSPEATRIPFATNATQDNMKNKRHQQLLTMVSSSLSIQSSREEDILAAWVFGKGPQVAICNLTNQPRPSYIQATPFILVLFSLTLWLFYPLFISCCLSL